MIERFKAEREERKDRQIADKTANAAVQFRRINHAQKIVDRRQKL